MQLHPHYPNAPIEKVLETEGNAYYRFVDAEHLPEIRRAYFGTFMNEFQQGMTDEDLVAYMKEIILETDAEHKRSHIIFVAQTVIDRVQNTRSHRSLYQVASLFYFTLEEDLGRYDFTLADQKIKDFKAADPDSFFLEKLLQHLGMYLDSSLAHIRPILRQMEVKEKAHEAMLKAMQSSRSAPITAQGGTK